MIGKLDDRIYIGGWQDAAKATQPFVITVAEDSPFCSPFKFDLVDGPGNSPNVFNAAVEEVVRALRETQKDVLVHCVSGRSRSAAVAVAAMAMFRNISICEAYDQAVGSYDKIRIHPAFGKLLGL